MSRVEVVSMNFVANVRTLGFGFVNVTVALRKLLQTWAHFNFMLFALRLALRDLC